MERESEEQEGANGGAAAEERPEGQGVLRFLAASFLNAEICRIERVRPSGGGRRGNDITSQWEDRRERSKVLPLGGYDCYGSCRTAMFNQIL